MVDKVNIAIATMTKNQGSRLEEWVRYHFSIGFSKFIIFLDSCTDTSYETLKALEGVDIDVYNTSEIEDGEHLKLTWIKRSHKMYDYTIKSYSHLDWIGFIEVDEFIFLQNNNLDFLSLLSEQQADCVYINSWDFKPPFDESKQILGQSNLVWTDRQRANSIYTWRGKSIIRPSMFKKCVDAHHFFHKDYGISKEFKMGRNEESFTQQYHGKEVYIDDSLLRIYHFRNHSPSNMNEYRSLEY